MTLAPRRWAVLPAVLLIACSHADPFDNTQSTVGAFNSGPDVRLTLNANQDYWPSWTEDGQGILYSYIESVTIPQHRCLGLLPAAGGTRSWQLCDDRAVQTDSTNSFIAYALGSDGRLLYAEAVAKGGVQSTAPAEITLWLADSAAPFQRRALLTLPTFAQGTPIAWLADINWTGPASFIALAQDFTVLGHCLNCGPVDSIFYGQAVVRGTVTAAGATLQVVPGTNGATSYSLAENGASIAFILRDDAHLYRVPAAGGTATSVALVSPNGGVELLGVSCKAATCIVAVDPVTLSAVTANGVTFGHSNIGATELRAVSLTSGQVQVTRTTTALVATPQISPTTGDVVVQLGGAFGHLQSFTTSGSDLHLFQGLVP
jgi:hypothetical protein